MNDVDFTYWAILSRRYYREETRTLKIFSPNMSFNLESHQIWFKTRFYITILKDSVTKYVP